MAKWALEFTEARLTSRQRRFYNKRCDLGVKFWRLSDYVDLVLFYLASASLIILVTLIKKTTIFT